MDLVANQVRHHLCHSKIHQRPIAQAEAILAEFLDENIKYPNDRTSLLEDVF